MKRFMSICFIVFVTFSLCACGGGTASSQGENTAKENAELQTTKGTETQVNEEVVPENKEINIAIDDNLTIVEAKYSFYTVGQKDYVKAKLRIKNNTSTSYDMIGFQFHYYDKNGDKVASRYMDVSDFEAEHSTWTSDLNTELSADEFGSVKIEYYKLMERTGDNSYSTIDQINLDPKTEVLFEDMYESD